MSLSQTSHKKYNNSNSSSSSNSNSSRSTTTYNTYGNASNNFLPMHDHEFGGHSSKTHAKHNQMDFLRAINIESGGISESLMAWSRIREKNQQLASRMKNLPIELVTMILEHLDVRTLFLLSRVVQRWEPTCRRILQDKLSKSVVTLFFNQEGFRPFTCHFRFHSYNATTDTLCWKPTVSTSTYYNKTFGQQNPVLREINVDMDESLNYLREKHPVSLKNVGIGLVDRLQKKVKPRDRFSFLYEIKKHFRDDQRVRGERDFYPRMFECSLDFLEPPVPWTVKTSVKKFVTKVVNSGGPPPRLPPPVYIVPMDFKQKKPPPRSDHGIRLYEQRHLAASTPQLY